MLSDLFSCCDSIATIHVPSFLLLYVFLPLQRHLRPISPAKMTETKLWTLITFFWLGRFAPYCTKCLRYRYRSFIQSLLLFLSSQKKVIFLWSGPIPKSGSRKWKIRKCKKSPADQGRGCPKASKTPPKYPKRAREGRIPWGRVPQASYTKITVHGNL